MSVRFGEYWLAVGREKDVRIDFTTDSLRTYTRRPVTYFSHSAGNRFWPLSIVECPLPILFQFPANPSPLRLEVAQVDVAMNSVRWAAMDIFCIQIGFCHTEIAV